jgi:hypothetical protein
VSEWAPRHNLHYVSRGATCVHGSSEIPYNNTVDSTDEMICLEEGYDYDVTMILPYIFMCINIYIYNHIYISNHIYNYIYIIIYI